MKLIERRVVWWCLFGRK